ncbi:MULTISPECIES: Trp biosynthesis-associated membrane protein [Arthrobacter]|uniref:Trp biosynthesis-associated membrane protein n=2 Tax=Arthrobacter TaxID=1663 RepID=A0ABU9KG90_9MICC|nr:Trp biosynthesis-associated membrane protein [Arthrobacter sp. YJM1]MDP5225911.1 Trp biosynthesis-associated membrane protein [Arthrobacter sp. YJM1]
MIVTPAPRWSRKATVVLITLLLAAAAFGTTTQSWINVTLAQSGVRMPDLHVAGSKAATAVTALAVVGVAGSLAITIAGRIARWVIAVAIALAGIGIVAAGLTVITDPHAAADGEIARQTGVSNGPAGVALTALPAVAVVCGALLVLCALWLLAASRHWVSRGKYDGAGSKGAARPAARDASEAADDDPLDAIDSWDRLSRGEDPS